MGVSSITSGVERGRLPAAARVHKREAATFNLYASKAHPVVIVQSNEVRGFDSVILCLLTNYDSSDIPTRVRVEPSPENGLTSSRRVAASS